MTLILGIETSCDETAAALVTDGREIRSNVVASQIALHAQFGGVYPEMASREHVLKIVPVVERALLEGNATWKDLDAIAVTYGPGLAGSLLVGVNFAKGLALAKDVPLLGINHLEGHIYASWLAFGPLRQSTGAWSGAAGHRAGELPAGPRPPVVGTAVRDAGVVLPAGSGAAAPPTPEFPLLCLIVSGGHTELILMRGHGQYEQLGSTRDDAAGEAFDKVARLLGLGYPGGPAIQKAAEGREPAGRSTSPFGPAGERPTVSPPTPKGLDFGTAARAMGSRSPAGELKFPRAWLEGTHDFSFSGLKTAVLNRVHNEQLGRETSDPAEMAEIAARKAQIAHAFQEAVVDVLVEKTRLAAAQYSVKMVLVGGGVAANQRLREQMRANIAVPVLIPPIALCTDNGAVIAAAGHYRFSAGERSGWDLDVVPGLRLVV